jgi:hypothetical protein
MKRKASLLALKDLMQTVVKPALLASFKMPESTSGKEEIEVEEPEEKEMEFPKELVDEEYEGNESEQEPMAEEKPKGVTISITKLAALERQKNKKSRKK